ncbi:MAG: tetratricopeptide repeat protein [Anaerolineae bacterium]|nr:tetratricopeptide repeat protein [Anaerolineae bacterium]
MKRNSGLRMTNYGLRMALILILTLLFLTSCASEVVKYNEEGNEKFEAATYDEALEAYSRAQVAEPDRAEPYYNAANTYNRQQNVEAALAQTEQALKTADPALAAQAWYNLGNAYFDAQQWTEAVEAYKASLRLQPEDNDAKHNLELAAQKLQNQQQQAQENQDTAQQNSENQESEERKSQEQESQPEEQQQQEEQAQATPDAESSDSQAGNTDATPEPSGEGEQQQTGMTEAQAMQLLQALLNESETLQEHLQEVHVSSGEPPEEDW